MMMSQVVVLLILVRILTVKLVDRKVLTHSHTNFSANQAVQIDL
jgi:hypothetical protein